MFQRKITKYLSRREDLNGAQSPQKHLVLGRLRICTEKTENNFEKFGNVKFTKEIRSTRAKPICDSSQTNNNNNNS